MRDVKTEIELNRKKQEGTETAESTSSAPVKEALVTTETEGVPAKSTVEKASGVPVMTEQEGVPVTTETEGALVKSTVKDASGAPVTTEPKGAPVKPVKGASQAEPKGGPANIGGKSGGKGGKPKSSSKKG